MRARSVSIVIGLATAALAAGQTPWQSAMTTANVLYYQGNTRQAETVLRAALPEAQRAGNTPVAQLWNEIGSVYLTEGRCEDADAAYERSLHLWDKVQGHEPERLRTGVNLMVAYLECGRFDAARNLRRNLIDPNLHWLPRDSTQYARYLATAADLEYHQRNFRQAETLLRDALDVWESHQPRDPQLALTLNNLSVVELTLGKRALAEEHANRSFALLQEYFPKDHVMLIKAYNNQATVNYLLGNRDEAARLLSEALRRSEGQPLSDVIRLQLLENYRVILHGQKRKDEEKRVAATIKTMRSGLPGNHTVDVRELSAFR